MKKRMPATWEYFANEKTNAIAGKCLERSLTTFLRRLWDPPPGGGSVCLRRAAHKARWVVFNISQLNGWEAVMGKLGHFYFNIWIQVKNGKLCSSRPIK
jgi:hypothetical protein